MKKLLFTILFLSLAVPCFAKSPQYILFVRKGDLWKYDFGSKKEELFIKNAKSPACSKDRKKIAFVRDGNIWIADITGKNEVGITDFKTDNDLDSLEWFPSGESILFSRDEEYSLSYAGDDRKLNWPPGEIEQKNSCFATRSIWIFSLKDSSLTKFIGHTPGSLFDNIKLTEVDSPKWCPNSKEKILIFTRGGDIWLASIGSDGLVELDKEEARIAPVASLADHYGASPASYVANHLSWSPDGKKILYEIVRHNGSGTGDIYEIKPDGKGEKKIYSAENDCYPVYSPSGKKIAFIMSKCIYVLGKNKHPKLLIKDVDVEHFIWLFNK
jgi:Tol biopolymer transport system component